ncbi:MAG: hypothetical protein ACREDW_11430 [Aestuariivirgaceae bacterium]
MSAAAALAMINLFMEFNLLGNDAGHHGCVVPTLQFLFDTHFRSGILGVTEAKARSMAATAAARTENAREPKNL